MTATTRCPCVLGVPTMRLCSRRSAMTRKSPVRTPFPTPAPVLSLTPSRTTRVGHLLDALAVDGLDFAAPSGAPVSDRAGGCVSS